MTETGRISGGITGAEALHALLGQCSQLSGVSDREWAAAAGLIVKKLLISAGQTTASLVRIRDSVGDDIFISQLKSLTHYQARLLARRLDRNVPEFEVSSASAAIAHIRGLLAAGAPGAIAAQNEDAGTDPWAGTASLLGGQEEETQEHDAGEADPAGVPGKTPPAGSPSYFGRRSFRG